MTRQDVINNIMASYEELGVTQDQVETLIISGEREGFSYQTIYTGLRMAFGQEYGKEELFTAEEVSEALGVSENEVIQTIEQVSGEMVAAGENPDQHFKKRDPVQRFIIPPSKYLS